jgi:hypothetical protein
VLVGRAGRPARKSGIAMTRAHLLTSRRSPRGARDSARVCTPALIAAVGLLTAPYNVRADDPMAPPKCAMHLSVEVTPDVPNPSDAGFISSLLGNHAGYQLFLLHVASDTHVELQLQGPGPNERCQEVVDDMSDDGRVESIDVI